MEHPALNKAENATYITWGKTGPRPPTLEFFSTIQAWIEECGTTTHRLCLPPTAAPLKLPTRVLKIEQERGDFKVRLHEGSGEEVRYATLSHCWGKCQPLSTTKENLPDHLKEIKWSSLPRTFQDAVTITHGLGIHYLWIDSLCIIQNDKDDWETEAAQMKNVYTYSYLTIAAAGGNDSHHGLFPREQDENSHDKEREFVRCARHYLWTSSVLFTRAWVLQERLLSVRTLYFYEDEVLMECPSNVRCQCSGANSLSNSGISFLTWAETLPTKTCVDNETFYYRFFDAGMQMNLQFVMRQLQGESTVEDMAPLLPLREALAMLRLWDELLGHYCQRDITKYSDRLPAISGVACAFGGTGVFGQYFGGIWSAWALQLLLWYIDSEELLKLEPPSEDELPLAPSWSWASVRGAWSYRRFPVDACVATFKHCDMEFVGPSSLGAMKKGIITVEGFVTKATIQYDPLLLERQHDPDFTYAERLKAQKVELVKDGEKVKMCQDFVLDAVRNPVNSGAVVICLGLQVNKYSALQAGEQSQPSVMQGLVLRIVKINPVLFSRIGVFQSPMAWFEPGEKAEITIC